MTTKHPAGPPMTLGDMRELGVQNLIASCLNDACRHVALIDVSAYPAETEVPSFRGPNAAWASARRCSNSLHGRHENADDRRPPRLVELVSLVNHTVIVPVVMSRVWLTSGAVRSSITLGRRPPSVTSPAGRALAAGSFLSLRSSSQLSQRSQSS